VVDMARLEDYSIEQLEVKKKGFVKKNFRK
jgi:hypothetical protein